MVYIILGAGFEETEAVAPYDVLKRGGVDVKFAGIGGHHISGSHGVTIITEETIDDIMLDKTELVIVPGGMRGVATIKNTPAAMQLIRKAYDEGKMVAAICAGPTVLSDLGIMDGRHGVCYPGMENQVKGGIMSQETSTVIDGNVTTGRAAAASFDFGLTLLSQLRGDKVTAKVASDICHNYGE